MSSLPSCDFEGKPLKSGQMKIKRSKPIEVSHGSQYEPMKMSRTVNSCPGSPYFPRPKKPRHGPFSSALEPPLFYLPSDDSSFKSYGSPASSLDSSGARARNFSSPESLEKYSPSSLSGSPTIFSLLQDPVNRKCRRKARNSNSSKKLPLSFSSSSSPPSRVDSREQDLDSDLHSLTDQLFQFKIPFRSDLPDAPRHSDSLGYADVDSMDQAAEGDRDSDLQFAMDPDEFRL